MSFWPEPEKKENTKEKLLKITSLDLTEPSKPKPNKFEEDLIIRTVTNSVLHAFARNDHGPALRSVQVYRTPHHHIFTVQVDFTNNKYPTKTFDIIEELVYNSLRSAKDQEQLHHHIVGKVEEIECGLFEINKRLNLEKLKAKREAEEQLRMEEEVWQI